MTNEITLHTHGLVRVLDVMGDDQAIVDAARISYSKGTKTTRKSRDLIRYLYRNKHTSPFEMCEIKFLVKAPIFIARQWVRHRTANINEWSGRYSIMENEFYIPTKDYIAYQSQTNNQGRGETFDAQTADNILATLNHSVDDSFITYDNLLGYDLARETARIVLPLNTYTTWVWKIDLHNLLHFLTLRAHPHAQREIRDYAEAIISLVQPLFPDTFEAWEDYQRQAKTFSRMEMGILKMILSRPDAKDYLAALIEDQNGVKNFAEKHGMSNREMNEFLDKISK